MKSNSQWNKSLTTSQKSGFGLVDRYIIPISAQIKEKHWSSVEKASKPWAWGQGAAQEVKSTALSLRETQGVPFIWPSNP